MAKRKIGDVIWLALVCAKDDRKALVDAYGGNTSQEAVKQAMADIRAFESLQMKLFGTTKTELQRMMGLMTSKSLLKISSDEIDDVESGVQADGALCADCGKSPAMEGCTVCAECGL